jgi:hypothetical protein
MGEKKVRGFGGVCEKWNASGNFGYMPVIMLRITVAQAPHFSTLRSRA